MISQFSRALRSLKWSTLMLLGVSVLPFAGLLVAYVQQQHATDVAKLEAQLTAAANTHMIFLRRGLDDHDAFLVGLRPLIQQGASPALLAQILGNEVAAHSDVLDVLLLDKHGNITHSVQQNSLLASMADRSYFTAHQQAPAQDKVHLSLPLVSRQHNGQAFIAMSRPLQDAHGLFNGVIVTMLSIEGLVRSFDVVPRPTSASAMGGHTGGQMLFRLPRIPNDVGMSLPKLAQEAGIVPKLGLMRARSPFDGEERMVVVQVMSTYPLLVTVSEKLSLLETRLSQQIQEALLAFLLFLLPLLVLAARLLRQITRRDTAEVALVTSEIRYRSLVDSLPQSITVIDKHFNILLTNHALEGMFHKPQDCFLGKTCHRSYAHQDSPCADCPGVLSMQDGQLHETVTRGVREDGSCFYVFNRTIPYLDADGQAAGFVEIMEDITERKQIEDELRRSNAELEQFAYAISHDMRQPLRMIVSYQQLLEKALSASLTEESREYLHFATDGAKRLDQMLVGLLDYSRVGRKTSPMLEIASQDALEEALLFLRPAITEAHAVIHIEGEWPSLFASRDELTRLLQNLIGNAIKYRFEGVVPILTLSGSIADEHWTVCVADNGIGIAEGQTGRLFQVFQRLQSRAKYEGTGVGLALCRKIVEHHGGTLWAESEGEGKGSRFIFRVPLRPAVSPSRDARPAESEKNMPIHTAPPPAAAPHSAEPPSA